MQELSEDQNLSEDYLKEGITLLEKTFCITRTSSWDCLQMNTLNTKVYWSCANNRSDWRKMIKEILKNNDAKRNRKGEVIMSGWKQHRKLIEYRKLRKLIEYRKLKIL